MNRRELMQAAIGAAGCAALPPIAVPAHACTTHAVAIPLWAFSDVRCGVIGVSAQKLWLELHDGSLVEVDDATFEACLDWKDGLTKNDQFFTNITHLNRMATIR